ncbi:MAG: hypothetical protein WKF37_12955 [Bryobacteraceae bacterium]
MAILLRQECIALASYLTGLKPSGYVIRKYVAYHEDRPGLVDPFDRILLNTTGWGNLTLWLADVYCTRFRKHSELRRRLVVTLALLECSPETAAYLDSPSYSNRLTLVVGLGAKAAASIGAGLLSLGLFEPVRLWCRLRHGRKSACPIR